MTEAVTVDLGYIRGPQGLPGKDATVKNDATQTEHGLMSAEDKRKLDEIESTIDASIDIVSPKKAQVKPSCTGSNSVALGHGCLVKNGSRSVAIGNNVNVSDKTDGYTISSAVAIGDEVKCKSGNSVCIGHSIDLSDVSSDINRSINIGNQVSSKSDEAVAIGSYANCNGARSVSIGSSTNSYGYRSIAIGSSTYAGSSNAEATSESTGYNIAIGANVNASAYQDVAIGCAARTSSSSYGSSKPGKNISIGASSITQGTESISIGSSANAYAVKSMSIGSGAYTGAEDAIAIGTDAKANYSGSIAIGQSSETSESNCVSVGCEPTVYPGTVPTRKIINVSNPENDQDAATKIYVDEKVSSISSGLSKSAIIDVIYPVGSVYLSISSASPENIFTGTKWTQISNRFLYAVGSGSASCAIGGSNDAVVVSHSHTAFVSSSGVHKHDLRLPLDPSDTSHTDVGDGLKPIAIDQSNTKTYWGGGMRQKDGQGGHTHTVTVDSTGSIGTGKNMPAYFTVYAWYRTA